MGIMDAVFSVFGSIGDWFVEFMPTLLALFWTPGTGSDTGSLTLLGVLAVAGLGMSVVFLMLGLVQRFFHWGG